MKKMVRKGFSMIELLFVMVILASLAAIAIPSMSSGTDSAALTSMRSDARNIIALVQSKYIDTQDYKKVLNDTTAFSAYAEESGFSENTLVDNTQIPLSKNNSVDIIPLLCNGTGDYNGFEIIVRNSEYTEKFISYNSCVDGKIQIKTTENPEGSFSGPTEEG